MNYSRRTTGLTLAILGLVFLILNALDYVMGWNQMSSAFTAIGIMLCLVGAGLARCPQDTQKQR